MPIGFMIIIFLAATAAFAAVFLLLTGGKGGNSIQERAKRRRVFAEEPTQEELPASVLKREIVQQQSAVRKRLSQLNSITRMLDKSGCGMQFNVFVLLTIIMAAIGAACTWAVHRNPMSTMLGAGLMAMIPYLYVKVKLGHRVKLLTEQFPDALEILTSTLRSGQAFATGLQTVAEEMPEPIATEFRITFEEQNYGVSMSEALQHTADRVGTMDMDFFVTAVNIQRETGGNLAEILDNLGRTIRQRFKIIGHIKTLTAQGKLSGYIIGAMPLGIALLLMLVNPTYMNPMIESPVGQTLLGISVGMQAVGFLIISKIVKIKI